MKLHKTFSGGIHPQELKEATRQKATIRAKVPPQVTIPLIQHTGAPCQPLVKVGDTVKKGQLIADAEQFITAPIHASISGVVKEIKTTPHPIAGKSLSITITSDGRDEWYESVKPRKDVAGLTKDEITDIIRRAGIVGLGGAAFPAHVKLKPPKKIDTVILNGAECEPYLTCDDRLMRERAQEVIKGLLLIMRAVDVQRAVVAIESNKPEAIEVMKKTLKTFKPAEFLDKELILRVLPVKYPQGSEKQLIETVLNRRVPSQSLPLHVGCVVHNVGTAVAMYQAVYEGKPLIERSITLSGDCIKEPLNIAVRIGTAVRQLVDDECGGFVRDVSKIIVGGPMMGIAQPTFDFPVIKGISGVLFLSERYAPVFDETACIRCGRCVNVCPMNLLPLVYAKLVKAQKWEQLKGYYIADCMECGSCAYVCPARIPLVQYVKTGKRELLKRQKK